MLYQGRGLGTSFLNPCAFGPLVITGFLSLLDNLLVEPSFLALWHPHSWQMTAPDGQESCWFGIPLRVGSWDLRVT